MGKLFFEHATEQRKPSWVKGRLIQITDDARIKLVQPAHGNIHFERMALTEKNGSRDLVSLAAYTFLALAIAAWLVGGIYLTAKALVLI